VKTSTGGTTGSYASCIISHYAVNAEYAIGGRPYGTSKIEANGGIELLCAKCILTPWSRLPVR